MKLENELEKFKWIGNLKSGLASLKGECSLILPATIDSARTIERTTGEMASTTIITTKETIEMMIEEIEIEGTREITTNLKIIIKAQTRILIADEQMRTHRT